MRPPMTRLASSPLFLVMLAIVVFQLFLNLRLLVGSSSSSCEPRQGQVMPAMRVNYYPGQQQEQQAQQQDAGLPDLPQPYSYMGCFTNPPNSARCKVVSLVRPRHERRIPPISKSTRTAAMCLFIGNEQLYVNEFVDYHLAIGFDEILVYDNSPDFNLDDWAKEKNTETKGRITITHFPGINRQIPAYQQCIEKAKQRQHTWMAAMDTDEILIMKKHKHVVDLLEEHCQSGTLSLYWDSFGHGEQTRFQPLPLTKRFLYSTGPVPLFKTLAKISDIGAVLNVHTISAKKPTKHHDLVGKNINGDFARVSSGAKHQQACDIAVIHHYWLKSLEEWFVKACWRGNPTNGTGADRKFANCDHSLTSTKEFGTKYNDEGWKAMKEYVPEYAVLDRIPLL